MNYSYHSDPRGAAFNVKVYGLRDVRGTEGQRSRAWDAMVEDWWSDAASLARKHGFKDVASCGRSDGWLVPMPVVQPGDDTEALEAFAEDLGLLFRQVEVLYAEYLTQVLAEDERRAQWTVTSALTWHVLDGEWWQVNEGQRIVAYATNETDAQRIMALLR